MIRSSRTRLMQAERIVRRLSSCDKNQVVFFDHKGALDSCVAGSERHVAMMNSVDFVRRVVGVFSPGVSAAMILSEAF